MSVEGPPGIVIKPFGLGFGYIMQHCGPAEPEIIAFPGQVVQHLDGMVKIVLVLLPVFISHPFEGMELGEDQFKQPRFIKQFETHRGFACQYDFVQFI